MPAAQLTPAADAALVSGYAQTASTMDLTALQDFLALAETGHFSRAATLRHVTQPAFSRRIRALEEWIGAPLFDRGAQPVTLTEAGQRFLPAAEDLMRRMMQAREAVRAASGLSTHTLRLAATHALFFTFAPPWLRGLTEDQTAVHLVSDSLGGCEQIMLAGGAQFLLCHHHDAAPNELELAGFRAARVGSERLLLVAAPDRHGKSRFARGPGAPYLAYSAKSGLGRILAATARDISAASPSVTHLAATLRAMAIAGEGLAWLPERIIADDLAKGTLIRTTGPDTAIDLAISLFRPPTPLGETAERFWDRVIAKR
jgi:DNA-binding transcriptional LysR family regulator